MKNPWEWDISDLQNLLGQPESLRLEFKDARLLGKDINKIVEDLSQEISAFANTEGGVLVIGVEEDKRTRPRVASRIEGVDIEHWRPERLQQIIESNISPPLSGIRVKHIFLDDAKKMCAYIISVPAGTTAYQAKDHKYYGRSEFERKSLPDHEIRMRMFRGKVPSANLIVRNIYCENAFFDEFGSFLHSTHDQSKGGKELFPGIKYSFDVCVKNTGDINVRSLKCVIDYSISRQFKEQILKNESMLIDCEFSFRDGWDEVLSFEHNVFSSILNNEKWTERPKMKVNIFPEDYFKVKSFSFGLKKPALFSEEDLILAWTLYLEDSRPSQGIIDIGSAFLKLNHENSLN